LTATLIEAALVLVAVMMALGVFTSVACAAMLLLNLVLETVFLRYLDPLVRQADVLPREVAFGFVYIPLATATATMLLSIGVNVFTDDTDYSQVTGAVIMVGSLYALFNISVWVARRMTKRVGLTWARATLASVSAVVRGKETATPEELQVLIRRVERWAKVGERITQTSRGLTFRTWVGWRWSRKQIALASISHTFALLALVLFDLNWAWSGVSGDQKSIVIGINIAAGLSIAVFFTAPLALWRLYRRRQLRVGLELTTSAVKNLEQLRLISIRPQPGYGPLRAFLIKLLGG
jgi:hypothetical protein